MSKEVTGCGCSAEQENEVAETKRQINIEFLYLDLSTCEPCKTSDENIVSALDEVAAVVRASGIELTLNRIHVETAKQALELGFQTSPTIRINGRDLQLDFKEAHCHSCSEISGTETSCRVWNFQGNEYKYLPKAMLVGAILREIYGNSENYSPKTAETNAPSENLQNFFAAKEQKEDATLFKSSGGK